LGKFFQQVSDELTLVVKQIAWLNTAPVDKNKKLAEQQPEKLTRKEQMQQNGEEIVLPDTCAPFLISYLLEVGPVIPNGLGPVPITWRDLEAWKSSVGIGHELLPWQARLLVQLSGEYLSFSKKAEQPDCPAPWHDEVLIDTRREAIARSLRVGFAALMSMPPKPKTMKRKGKRGGKT
jgi:hypothetical protein